MHIYNRHRGRICKSPALNSSDLGCFAASGSSVLGCYVCVYTHVCMCVCIYIYISIRMYIGCIETAAVCVKSSQMSLNPCQLLLNVRPPFLRQHLRPVRLLRVWISEGVTQANS